MPNSLSWPARLRPFTAALYLGVVLGVSFIATPAKFMAPLPLADHLQIGRVTFEVNAVDNDTDDVISGTLNGGFDGFFDNGNNAISATYGTASVVPEPTIVTLLGLGLVGIGVAGRRARK